MEKRKRKIQIRKKKKKRNHEAAILHVQNNVSIKAEHVIADEKGQKPNYPAVNRSQGVKGIREDGHSKDH
jgi:hypothetical protein